MTYHLINTHLYLFICIIIESPPKIDFETPYHLKNKAYEAVSTLPRMIRSNSSQDLRADIEAAVAAGTATAAPSRGGSAKNNNPGRARNHTLAYGVSAADLNLRNSDSALPVAGFTSTLLRNGSDNDILVARVPSREGEVYDVRGFESDMSAAIMHAQVRV